MTMGKEDDLLARELGKAGASGGAFASFGNPVTGIPSAAGGYLGASLAARFLPTERHQLELDLHADPQTVLRKAYALLSSAGRVSDSREVSASPNPGISGVVGSGFLNMNPAVVHMEIVAIESGRCRVLLTGAAKEGLIKQRTAEKAVNRLAAALNMLAGPDA
jgi:hypothetical protein